MRWNGGGKKAVYQGLAQERDVVRSHDCQKSLWLVRALLADFTNPNDLILDSHAGSGTTGAACIELGRNFVGWELDPKHHAIATRRLQEASKQQPLFRVATKQEQAKLAL
jgi:DNA modification methylase